MNQGQDKEIWKKLPNPYADYEVSSLGRVLSAKFGGRSILKPGLNSSGYRVIHVFVSGKKKSVFVHRLVLLAFYGESDLQGNHKNGIKTDNRLSNLEYCTRSENIAHAYKIGILPTGEKHHSSKLNRQQVKKIFHDPRSYQAIARDAGVCSNTIYKIKKRITWRSVTEGLSE